MTSHSLVALIFTMSCFALSTCNVGDMTSLPVTYPARVSNTPQEECTPEEQQEIIRAEIRQDIHWILQHHLEYSTCRYLLVSTSNEGIYRMNLDGSRVQQILTSADTGNDVYGLAVDNSGSFMYFASDGFVKKARLDGSDITTLSTGIYHNGLSFDRINNKLYMAINTDIKVYDPATGNTAVVYTGGSRIQDVVVDPFNDMMYWTDWGNDSIYKGSTDGSTSSIIHSTGIDSLGGITLDFSSQRLFWTDTTGIESSSTDGSNRTTVISSIESYDVFFSGGILYYAQQNPHQAKALDLNSGIITTLAEIDLPVQITVVFPNPVDCVEDIYVMAHTSPVSVGGPNTGTDDGHNVEIQLASGVTYIAALPNLSGDDADPGKGDLWRMSLANDFGIPQGTCVKKEDIVSIAIVEGSNDAWMIDSIITITRTPCVYEVVTVDMDVHRWIDGNGSPSATRFDLTFV